MEEDDDIQDYKKPWVGLTDDEIWETAAKGNDGGCFGDLHWQDCTLDFARAIEEKLRRKNQ